MAKHCICRCIRLLRRSMFGTLLKEAWRVQNYRCHSFAFAIERCTGEQQQPRSRIKQLFCISKLVANILLHTVSPSIATVLFRGGGGFQYGRSHVNWQTWLEFKKTSFCLFSFSSFEVDFKTCLHTLCVLIHQIVHIDYFNDTLRNIFECRKVDWRSVKFFFFDRNVISHADHPPVFVQMSRISL